MEFIQQVLRKEKGFSQPCYAPPPSGAAEKKATKAQPPVKQGLLKKGFLNPRSTATITLERDCIIPSSVEDNGFSQSRVSPVGFDHNEEIVLGGGH